MKIVVFKDLENDCILQVASMEYYRGMKKTEADVEKAITEFNMAHPNQQYVTLECTEEMYEAVCFILGERQYSKAHTLDDIFFQLTNLRDQIDGMKSDLYGIQNDIVDTMNNVDLKIEEINNKKKGGKKNERIENGESRQGRV